MFGSRHQRWITASLRLQGIEDWLIQPVQGLGWQDEVLAASDQQLSSRIQQGETSLELGLQMTYHRTQSYQWVLAAYEVVRTLEKLLRMDPQVRAKVGRRHPVIPKSRDVLWHVERLRVPLAKLEPAGRHRRTDSRIAFPVILVGRGSAWQVADDVIISRAEVADEVLDLIESLPDTRAPAAGGAP